MTARTNAASLATAVTMAVAMACCSAAAEEPAEEPPALPPEVYEEFVAAGFRPAAVIVILEGGDHEVFQVETHPFTKEDSVPVNVLKRPELTIQDSSSSCSKTVCSKYTCSTVSC